MKKTPLPPSTQAAAVITGAGSGIGRSFAYEVARRGGSVLCVDINEERAEQVAISLRALGTHAVALGCDVGDEKQMAYLAENAEPLLGRPVTLVINNAGVERPPGMSAKENEVWTQNEERKAYSEREAVAKAKDVEREKIEEETRKRGEEREAAVEAARIAKEQETTKQQQEMAAQKAAEQKEREDGARERETQAADRNAEAAEISKAANEKIAKTADAMKTQAESMKAAGEEMKRQAEKMQKEADKMQKEAVEAAAAASRANEQAMSANNAAMPSPSPGVVPAAAVAPTYTTEQDMEEAMAQAEKDKEAARKLFEDAAQANAVPVKREQEQEPAR